MRLGIFGGSFDPVHCGHLALARACGLQAALDEVWFMPAAIQPLKHRGPSATDAQRVQMLHLAIDGETTWRVSTLELDRGGFSYTFESLRQIQAELPDARLFFLLGADAVRDVPRWREPAKAFRLATPLIVRRAGQLPPDLTALAALCSEHTAPQLVEMPAVDASSTELRRRVANREPIDDLTPAPVAAYIAQHGLYRD